MYMKYLLFFLLTFTLFAACTDGVHAQGTDTGPASGSLENPLGTTDPRIIIGRVISGMLGLVGSIALLMFVYGGFLWVASGGNEDKITQGKNVILWSSLGLALIFLSYAMVQFVITAITAGSGS